jgi:hypothetical protein
MNGDESRADDGAIYTFWLWWETRRTRRDAPRSLDDPADARAMIDAYDAGEAP